MRTQSAFPIRRLGRCLLAAPLALALALGYAPAAHAQAIPKPEPAQKTPLVDATYYVDGKLTAQSVAASLDPSNISAINVLKKEAELKAFNSTTTGGTVLITTKANANSPAVVAFNKRINDAVPLVPATPAQEAAMAAITAYLAKTYPNAKAEFIAPLRTPPTTYKAVFTENGQRMSLLFDADGQPVK